MITPKFIIEEIEKFISEKIFGELKIIFQNGKIQRWTETVSTLAPKSSGTLENPGETAPQGQKLEE